MKFKLGFLGGAVFFVLQAFFLQNVPPTKSGGHFAKERNDKESVNPVLMEKRHVFPVEGLGMVDEPPTQEGTGVDGNGTFPLLQVF